MEIFRIVLAAIVGYLLGNIQTGVLIGKITSNIDLRKHGSGSSGATNALRVLGSKSALFTLLGDMLKGILASCAGLLIAGWYGGLLGALFVIIGHIWPAFYAFKGGKGVATSIGALLILMPWHTLLMVAVGLVVLLLGKMVSLASITGALVFILSGSITALISGDWLQLMTVIGMSALVIFAHRSNIQRLRNGTENKINGDMFKRK